MKMEWSHSILSDWDTLELIEWLKAMPKSLSFYDAAAVHRIRSQRSGTSALGEAPSGRE